MTLDAARFNPDGLALSDNYAETMEKAVFPAINARRTDRTVEGAGGRPLFVSRFDADSPRGTAVLVHGFTENGEKFAELIHSLLSQGWSVVAYDQRGHGRSWRAEGLAEISLTHVDRFGEYVEDLGRVVDDVLAPMPKPWVLFAHSMGGAVSALFLEQRPGIFDRVALCAPMIAPNLGGIPAPAGKVICGVPKLLGRGKKRMFVSKPYSYPEAFETSCATGRERFDWYETLRRDHPEFTNNGPTYGWTLEAIGVTKRILAPGAVERIDIPVRLYTAESDGSVLPEPQRRFVARLKEGRRTLVPGSRHEIYRSGDEVLFPWWHEILAFFADAAR